jgi:hypothetical protein
MCAADGSAHMVDVSAKAVTARSGAARPVGCCSAAACGRGPALGQCPQGGRPGRGPDRRDPGRQAHPRTYPAGPPDRGARRRGRPRVVDDGVEIAATVRTADRTGIEMEALTACQRRGARPHRHGQGRGQARPHHRRSGDGQVRRPIGGLDERVSDLSAPARELGRVDSRSITCSTRAAAGVYPDRGGEH